jgi:two-component system response regulator FixJ
VRLSAIAPTDHTATLLLVEDDPSLRAALSFAFEADGFQVRCYSDASELFREAEAALSANCLIIDYRLPYMDGLALLAALRRKEITTPAVLITSDPDRRCRRRARAAGVDIIEKPLLTDELRRHVHEVITAR